MCCVTRITTKHSSSRKKDWDGGCQRDQPVCAKHMLMAKEQGWQQKLLTLPTEYKRTTCRLRGGLLEMSQLKGQPG